MLAPPRAGLLLCFLRTKKATTKVVALLVIQQILHPTGQPLFKHRNTPNALSFLLKFAKIQIPSFSNTTKLKEISSLLLTIT